MLLDAGGTLLVPQEPVAETYARVAAAHRVQVSPESVRHRFREVFGAPREGRRYDGDGRVYWRFVVARCLGADDPLLFEALYAWYGRAEAWRVAPGAEALLVRLGSAGVARGLVSNWDARLPALLDALGLTRHLDAVVVSGLEGVEKPDPRAFWRACHRLGVRPHEALHVGDDPAADVAGALAAGLQAGRWAGAEALAHRLWP